ncbi:hypothetical protein AcV5_004316 [Taiwanofungus camphoratus]|nr:hypothetical protein AcV5_004316 [Antrodia cinnamomea]
MWFRIRRINEPWEVVDSRAVEPVPMYDDDDDLELVYVADTDLTNTYLFDRETRHSAALDLHAAVAHARTRLLREAARRGCNVLLLEGWCVTLLRKGRRHRVEVRYTARPARVANKPPARPPPPFLAVLDLWRVQAAESYFAAGASGESGAEGRTAADSKSVSRRSSKRWSWCSRAGHGARGSERQSEAAGAGASVGEGRRGRESWRGRGDGIGRTVVDCCE